MWHAAGTDDQLSQGDLLKEIPFPKVKLGLDITHALSKPVSILELQARSAIVVTQDCIIDKVHVRHIALAPVRPEGGLDPEKIAAIRAAEPPQEGGDDEAGYVYDYFAVDEHPGLLVAPPRGLVVADLKMIQPFEGPRQDFVKRRVAKMSVEAVRLLRINLASFWGRPSEEHALQLRDLGIPPGLA